MTHPLLLSRLATGMRVSRIGEIAQRIKALSVHSFLACPPAKDNAFAGTCARRALAFSHVNGQGRHFSQIPPR